MCGCLRIGVRREGLDPAAVGVAADDDVATLK